MQRSLVLLFLTACEFGPVVYIERAGTGSGEVTSDPGGLHCGDDCAMTVSEGAITLIAKPALGSRLTGWSVEGCEGLTCTVDPTSDLRVTAIFDAVYHTLSVTKSGTGKGSVASSIVNVIACGALCDAEVLDGTKFWLIAQPDENSQFVGWRGACSGLECPIVMDQSFEVEAVFEAKPKLTVFVSGNGWVDSLPYGISCSSSYPSCSYRFPPGSTVLLRPSTQSGGFVVTWEGCPRVLPMGCEIVIDGDQTVRAVFTPAT
jgi:hypothetical protein